MSLIVSGVFVIFMVGVYFVNRHRARPKVINGYVCYDISPGKSGHGGSDGGDCDGGGGGDGGGGE